MRFSTDFPVRQFALACLVLLIAAIFIGGEQPGAGSLFLPPWDKVVHLMVYGGIGLLAGLAFPRWSLPAIVLFTVGVGACDELHQAFLPGREAGLPDLLADFAGVLLFLPLLALMRRRMQPAFAWIRKL
jgi:VanZ family protein